MLERLEFLVEKERDLLVVLVSQCLAIELTYSMFIKLNSTATKPMQNIQHS